MEGTLNNGMCRCCASEGTFKDLSSKYIWMGEEEIYSDMLQQCFDITLIGADEGQEGGICEVCITQLRNAANFKKQVQHTEEQFKRRLEDNMFKPTIVKLEVAPIDDDGGDQSDNNHSDDMSVTEYEVPIKTETEETKGKKRTKGATTRSKKTKVEDAETSKRSAVTRSQNVSHNLQKSRSTKRNSDVDTETELREIYKHQANLNILRQCSNATPIRSRGGIGYKCSYCTDEYPNPADLKSHTIEHHSDESARKIMAKEMNVLYSYVIKLDITALKCTICDTGFDSLDDFVYHLMTDHDKKIYTDIDDRIIPVKFEDKILSCVFCLQAFNKFKTLIQHMNVHYRNFVCDVCNAGFVSRNLLYNHSFTHRVGEFKCSLCEKTFDTIVKQKAHEKTVHQQARRNTCGFCNMKFRDFKKKELHLTKMHGVAIMRMECHACHKTFPDRKRYTVHMKRDHLIEREHHCQECEMSFFRFSELKKHMIKHTGEKNYECSVCKKSYGRKNTLTEHMKIHNNIRNYKCSYCNMKFIQKCTWKMHLKAKHLITNAEYSKDSPDADEHTIVIIENTPNSIC